MWSVMMNSALQTDAWLGIATAAESARARPGSPTMSVTFSLRVAQAL